MPRGWLCALRLGRSAIDWMEIDKPTMAKQIWVDKAIQEAEFVLERIDKRWPGER
jgi:hypothetical protein